MTGLDQLQYLSWLLYLFVFVAVLVRTIPGCERLETVGQDQYRMTVTAGVASIKGTYLGDVALADHVPYSAFTLRASGSGAGCGFRRSMPDAAGFERVFVHQLRSIDHEAPLQNLQPARVLQSSR